MPAKEHNRFHTFLIHKTLQPSLETLIKFCIQDSEYYYRFTKETLEIILQDYPEIAKNYKKTVLVCTVKDCTNFRYGRKLVCNKHYQREKAKGRGFWKTNKNITPKSPK
jgi:arabinogalactan endo-1,4-beta-galactosidase